MPRQIISSPEAPAAIGSYSQAVRCGDTVYLSGQIALDPGSGTAQEYVQDCETCCRPWTVQVTYDASGRASVELSAE